MAGSGICKLDGEGRNGDDGRVFSALMEDSKGESSVRLDKDDDGELWLYNVDDDGTGDVVTLLALPPMSSSSRNGSSSRNVLAVVDLLYSIIRDVSL